MKANRKKLYEACKAKMLEIKQNHRETLHALSTELVNEATGDIGDQARKLQEETLSLARRNKISHELQEIENALARMEDQSYGICEETGNEIEEKRLKAIPWTRLSLEGAEIREMERQEQEELA